MRTFRSFVVFICIIVSTSAASAQRETNIIATWHVYFSPRGGATEALIEALDHAESSILVQANSFTSEPVAWALVSAHRRGVRVAVLLDWSHKTQLYSVANLLARASIPIFIDAAHAIAHNKVMVIDDETVITGSFNFTKAAEEKNAENLLIIESKVLAAKYTGNWKVHLRHSAAYSSRSRPR